MQRLALQTNSAPGHGSSQICGSIKVWQAPRGILDWESGWVAFAAPTLQQWFQRRLRKAAKSCGLITLRIHTAKNILTCVTLRTRQAHACSKLENTSIHVTVSPVKHVLQPSRVTCSSPMRGRFAGFQRRLRGRSHISTHVGRSGYRRALRILQSRRSS